MHLPSSFDRAWEAYSVLKGGFGKSILSLCLQPFPLNNLSPNQIVSVRFQVLYAAIYINGVLGKATIQSHSLPIEDLNIADPPTTPLEHLLFICTLYTGFRVIGWRHPSGFYPDQPRQFHDLVMVWHIG